MEDLTLNLDFKKEPIVIEFDKSYRGRIVIHIYEGDSPKEIKMDDMLYIQIHKNETLNSNIMASYHEEINGFIFSVRNNMAEEAGDKPAIIGIVNNVEGTEELHQGIWRVK